MHVYSWYSMSVEGPPSPLHHLCKGRSQLQPTVLEEGHKLLPKDGGKEEWTQITPSFSWPLVQDSYTGGNRPYPSKRMNNLCSSSSSCFRSNCVSQKTNPCASCTWGVANPHNPLLKLAAKAATWLFDSNIHHKLVIIQKIIISNGCCYGRVTVLIVSQCHSNKAQLLSFVSTANSTWYQKCKLGS